MILFSGLLPFSGPFCGNRLSPLNRGTTVLLCTSCTTLLLSEVSNILQREDMVIREWGLSYHFKLKSKIQGIRFSYQMLSLRPTANFRKEGKQGGVNLDIGNKVHGLFQRPSCHENNRGLDQCPRVVRGTRKFHGILTFFLMNVFSSKIQVTRIGN